MPEQEIVVYDSNESALAEQRRFMPVMTLSTALDRRQIIVEATTKLMKEGVDFGKIPGAGDRPTLLQPGADKLCNLFGLVIKYEIVEQIKDWSGSAHDGEPFFYIEVRGRAYRGDVCMGEGIGSCSSWESKYRYRQGERKCPQCDKPAIIKGKAEYGGGYLCFAKKGGCGAKFPDGDKAIESQEVGRRPNPDVFDQLNTVQKMAFKRAKVSTTINATSASEFFTQDVEDNPPQEDPRVTAEQYKEKAAAAKKGDWARGKAAQQEVLERKMREATVSPAGRAVPPGVTDDDIPEIMGGTFVAPENPAEQYKAHAKTVVFQPPTLEQNLTDSIKQAEAWKEKAKSTDYSMMQHFGVQKKRFAALGCPEKYSAFLGAHGVEHCNEFPDTAEGKKSARECYRDMQICLSDLEASGMVPTGGQEEAYRMEERRSLSE